MFMDRSPADELARIRARIAELRAREAALKAAFIEGNETGRFEGFAHDVVVQRTEQEVFDITRLPGEILENPLYYRTRFVTEVRTEPKTGAFLDLSRTGSWNIDSDGEGIEPRRA
ncbi:hypothetical protein ACP2AV_09055 [Aliiroseovarius sp. PTFE2010]|uniref:hypothetical protein n=1 Tax=Aliiroseovarius sp. PTFE2010 TaxID=3417190 RepID=UPI003CF19E46